MRLAIAGLLAVAALTAGCGDDSELDKAPSSEGTSTGFSDSVRENFLKSCETTSNGQTSYCKCMLESAEEHFTESEFAAFERTVVQKGLDGIDPADKEWLETAGPECAKA